MPKMRSQQGPGSSCSLDLSFTRTSKTRSCDGLELIGEAIEVIYAFTVDAEPSEVRVHGSCMPCYADIDSYGFSALPSRLPSTR